MINLSEAVRDFPNLYEIIIDSEEDYKQTLEKLHNQLESVPLFVKTTGNNILVITEFESKKLPKKGITLIYVGQKI
jgi:predicted patatin/cPLA2 family phospholipase